MLIMKEDRLRKNPEFRLVYRRGKSYANSNLVLYVMKNRKQINRVGISVSKKVGKSVVRSRVKRLISESFRLNKEQLKQGYDLVFIARTAANGKTYKQIEDSIKDLLKKSGLTYAKENTNNNN